MTERFSRRVSTKPHHRRQPRCVDTVACGIPSRLTISPAESSPLSSSNRRMRRRVGSPRPRKYLPSRSMRLGEPPSVNGASEMTPIGSVAWVSISVNYDIGYSRYRCGGGLDEPGRHETENRPDRDGEPR